MTNNTKVCAETELRVKQLGGWLVIQECTGADEWRTLTWNDFNRQDKFGHPHWDASTLTTIRVRKLVKQLNAAREEGKELSTVNTNLLKSAS